jgi:hypothetical protein
VIFGGFTQAGAADNRFYASVRFPIKFCATSSPLAVFFATKALNTLGDTMMTKKTLIILATIVAFAGSTSARMPKPRKEAGQPVEWKDVPAAVQGTINSNAAGGKIVGVTKDTKKGAPIYRAEVKQTDGKMVKISVTDAGKLIKAKPDDAKNRKHKPLFGS